MTAVIDSPLEETIEGESRPVTGNGGKGKKPNRPTRNKTGDNDNDKTSEVEALTNEMAHSNQVFEWRKSNFLHLGWAELDAEFMALTNIELAAVRKLRVEGCSTELVEKILMGTNQLGENDENWGLPIPPADEEEQND